MSDDRPAAQPVDRPAGAPVPDDPVTFRELFGVPEYRAVYFSLLVNGLGDYLARAAIVVLVYQQTESVLLSAASFALSYLPWIVGGPVLAALAERYPYRRVLIFSDLARAVPIALIVLPGVPVYMILILLFVAMLGAPPTQAARSALLPQILDSRRIVSALAINGSTVQAAQVFGYLVGAVIATSISPRVGMALDAVSFLLSALILTLGVRPRPAAAAPEQRRPLLRETAEGFRLVFGTPALRSIALMVFTLATFTVLPEGLAAGWVVLFDADRSSRGFDQGLIMAAGPVGFVIGGLVVGRLTRTTDRKRLEKPFAILIPLALTLSAFAPNAVTVAALAGISGVALGGLMPALNGEFVLALPHGYRARAFGVMQGGLQLAQCVAVLATGALAQFFSIPLVVGLWSLVGLLAMTLLVVTRPRTAALPEVAPAPPSGHTGATRVTSHRVRRSAAGKLDR